MDSNPATPSPAEREVTDAFPGDEARKPLKGPKKFEEFWAALHPIHRIERRVCIDIWKKAKLEVMGDVIIAAYKDQLTWPDYKGDRVQFIKRAPSWLRKERWEDERPAPKAAWKPKRRQ